MTQDNRMVTRRDLEYPAALAAIHDPPETLYVRGDLAACAAPCVAIVGSRKCTPYGIQMTEYLVPALVGAGFTIVSGLALGIDGVAHDAALSAGGRTVAVLGTGADDATITPRAHLGLAHRILAANGAVVSEYPDKTKGTHYTFPRRNRIIAGLCTATIVIEAVETSGSLITAQCALDAAREVFAVPQNITSPTAAGVNRLIAAGAHPVVNAEELLLALHMDAPKPKNAPPSIASLSDNEQAVFRALGYEPAHIDEIIRAAKLASSTVMGTLTLLELKGMVRHHGGMLYTVAGRAIIDKTHTMR
jgi:DNA processing protein